MKTISPKEIKAIMVKYKIKLKTIAEETHLDKTFLSPIINGKRPMSKSVMAMFRFYLSYKTGLKL